MALRVLCCCSFIIALRALCNTKMWFLLFLESDGCYFLNWDAKNQVTVTFIWMSPWFYQHCWLNYATGKETTVVLLAGATSNSLRTVVFSFLLFNWNISHLKLWKATFTCPMLLKRLKKPSLNLIKTEILYFLLLAVEFSVYFKCWGLFRNISPTCMAQMNCLS